VEGCRAGGVWGIDIGQCALKALRCKLGDDGETLVATAFDYIEYPKILSQPEADREELISDALAQFLSRNDLRGDKVGISVSGQSGLARFFKPPPVEQKKIPDIVMYEARQQIPFSLDEVIWDYQQMPGASEEDGIALDMEIGLFAMKRDQVFKSIRPFEDHDVELDMVQLSPLCLYNCASHDLLEALPDDEEYDSEDPPESIALLSLGTDASDLVVTNGYRVWQRSIPLGGSHFTRQLTKELKLTFAKAEHLKRNARQAEDPRKIFQAMRPVFNDLVTEVRMRRAETIAQTGDHAAAEKLFGEVAEINGFVSADHATQLADSLRQFASTGYVRSKLTVLQGGNMQPSVRVTASAGEAAVRAEGNTGVVAPNSVPILAITCRSMAESRSSPGP